MLKSLLSLLKMFAFSSPSRRKPVPLRIWFLSCLSAAGFFALPEIRDLPRIEISLPDFEDLPRLQIGLPELPRLSITLVRPNQTPTSPPVQGNDPLIGTATVIDGDTIEIHGTRIRLHAVDAPETRQTCKRADGSSWRCGVEASRALDDFVGRATVTCEKKQTDRYGRIVARCLVRGKDLGEFMVREGWAVAYRQYGKVYVPHEEEARRARRRLWAGNFDMPWDFRRKKS